MKPRLFFGICIFVLGYFFAASFSACRKGISGDISLWQILFVQNAVCLLCSLPQIIHRGVASLRTQRLELHLARDLSGVISFFSLFFALEYIPLVNAVLLSFTGPLWVPFIARLWTGVWMKGVLWWGVLIGFLGVILILKPEMGILELASLVALFSGLLSGFNSLSVARLRTTEPTHRILFYYFCLGTLLSFPFFLTHYSLPSQRDALCLLGVGFFAFWAQFCITYAFKLAKAEVLSPFSYTIVLFSALLGWGIWGETPDLYSALGAVLIVIGGMLSLYFEQRSRL